MTAKVKTDPLAAARKDKAGEILHRVWICGDTFTSADAAFCKKNARQNEPYHETLLRINEMLASWRKDFVLDQFLGTWLSNIHSKEDMLKAQAQYLLNKKFSLELELEPRESRWIVHHKGQYNGSNIDIAIHLAGWHERWLANGSPSSNEDMKKFISMSSMSDFYSGNILITPDEIVDKSEEEEGEVQYTITSWKPSLKEKAINELNEILNALR